MEEKRIKEKDFYHINYYEYGKAYLGSYKGMRFRLARNPLENVVFKSKEEKEAGVLVATIWPEPFSYDTTPDEKTSKEFPFTEEGKIAAVDWLNEQYNAHEDEWKKSVNNWAR